MERVTYERPREKLHRQGVDALSSVELVQLIIGSGSSKSSAAKLARMVEALAHTGALHYTQLRQIEGIGEAKACQLMALYEYARRYGGSQ